VFAVVHMAGQAPAASLQVLTREARRTIPIATSGQQELVTLDELATTFQLNVRDDGGAITVGYKGRSIVLTPDQTIASVAGRLISLPVAPTRSGRTWLVPLDFINRALAPIYDTQLDLRRASHLLVVGDLRVPRVTIRHEALTASARVTFDASPATTTNVTQQNQRLLIRFDADALDTVFPVFQSAGFIGSIHAVDAVTVGIDLGPRFATYRATTQPLDNGTRLVVEVAGAQTEAAPPPPPQPESPAELPPVGTPLIRTIAIDPGHGGSDVGARGAGGAQEKDIALAVARRLRGALEARLGVRVVMTRDDDRDMPLAERTALANNNKADLLISLHANASFRPEVSGATVYAAAFNEADPAQRGLVPERLPVFGGGLRDIEVVPWNLAQIRHRDRSDQLAQYVANALNGKVPVSSRPVEHAPLRILESANMPAALVEMGYLTNADQEKALAGAELQTALTQALFDAITRFRDGVTAEGAAR
jgi:N-acetylmuramoyl-L-alanine amidase